MKTIVKLLLVSFSFTLFVGCSSTKHSLVTPPNKINDSQLETLPKVPFKIHKVRTDLDRKARPYSGKYTGPIIDTVTHLYSPINGILPDDKQLITLIKDTGVEKIFFMPTPNDGIKPYPKVGVERRIKAKTYDQKTIFLFTGYEISNWLHDAYRYGYNKKELENIIKGIKEDSKNYIGVGEIASHHYDKGFGGNRKGGQNVIEYPLNFKPFLKILKAIEDNNLCLVLHIEPVEANGKSHEDEIFTALELLHQKFPKLKLIFSHTMMTNTTNVKNILNRYPNVMMSIKTINKHNKWKNLEPVVNENGDLYEDWAQLFEQMPNRFMIGTDMHFGRYGVPYKKYKKKIKRVRKVLNTLKPKVVKMIAYENAKSLIENNTKSKNQ